jgi:hypothetical protein
VKSKDNAVGSDEIYAHIAALIEEAKVAGPTFWHSRTPQERIQALELMRQRTYGYDSLTAPRLQRVLEIDQRKQD